MVILVDFIKDEDIRQYLIYKNISVILLYKATNKNHSYK